MSRPDYPPLDVNISHPSWYGLWIDHPDKAGRWERFTIQDTKSPVIVTQADGTELVATYERVGGAPYHSFYKRTPITPMAPPTVAEYPRDARVRTHRYNDRYSAYALTLYRRTPFAGVY